MAVRKDAHSRHEDGQVGRATGGLTGATHHMDARHPIVKSGKFEITFLSQKVVHPPKIKLILKS